MKKLVALFFALSAFSLFSQEKEVKKLEYVIIANDTIITQEELNAYGKKGLIKGMNKGVSQEERDKLADRFGDKIGDKEFIIKIDLFSEKEKNERQNNANTKVEKTKEKKLANADLRLNIDDIASDFTVEMVDGQNITLSDLKGKVVLLNYWATWCAPCLMEFTEIPEKILQPFEGKNFVFIPISIGENKEKVEKRMLKMKTYGVDFNVGIDPKKEIWNQYASGSIPKNFIIDKKGVIRYVSTGNSKDNVDNLAIEIKKLLDE